MLYRAGGVVTGLYRDLDGELAAGLSERFGSFGAKGFGAVGWIPGRNLKQFGG